MDFTFAELKEYLDARFEQQEANIDDRFDTRFAEMNDRMDEKIDRLEATFLKQIGELRQEMHNNTAAITDTITRLNEYHDRRHDNHDHRLTRLEDRFA